ncbi:hypothetical protein E2C01_003522 [Portunus trituberculatus]|uniref:Uncharacterized protein n=1 Tax=Portunus trituberculatus TaxID=210409 RepID=A0A5B7CP11_PORTR|nr:hypothetical protein [Portunus trituberculatus]
MRRAGEWRWEAAAAAVVTMVVVVVVVVGVIVGHPGGGYSLTRPLSDQLGSDSTTVASRGLVFGLQGVHQEG